MAVIARDPGSVVQTPVARHAGLGSSLGSRIRLNAALAKTNNQSTFAKPRNLTLRIQAMFFNHPNAGSTRGRACWLCA
jgi:hypothetical protein